MADRKITDYSAKTDVHGEELIEIVDLRESSTASQNKKMTLNSLFSSIVTHSDAVVVLDGDVVYT